MKKSLFPVFFAACLASFFLPFKAFAFNTGWLDDAGRAAGKVLSRSADDILSRANDVSRVTSKAAREFAKSLNLQEMKALKYYCDKGYQKINELLRGNIHHGGNEDTMHNIILIDRVLRKTVIKKPMVVYRGSGMTREFARLLKYNAFGKLDTGAMIGKEIVEEAFLSTSQKQEKALSFAINALLKSDPNAPVKSVMRKIIIPALSKGGADISALSRYADEYEMLFTMGQKTIIKEVFLDESGILYTLEEMIPNLK
jgi:hypothetical protein